MIVLSAAQADALIEAYRSTRGTEDSMGAYVRKAEQIIAGFDVWYALGHAVASKVGRWLDADDMYAWLEGSL